MLKVRLLFSLWRHPQRTLLRRLRKVQLSLGACIFLLVHGLTPAYVDAQLHNGLVSFTLTVNASVFNFSLSNDGNKSVTQGQAVASTITATLSSESSQAVSFSTTGLPTGATASYTTSTSCNPTCSRTLNISTAASTPTGTNTITVTATGGGVTKTTSFT